MTISNLNLNASLMHSSISTLGLIHAESKLDYYTWDTLINNNQEITPNEDHFQKKIILDDWSTLSAPLKYKEFTSNLVITLSKLKKKKCIKIKYDSTNLLSFEVAFYNIFNAWYSFCKNNNFEHKIFIQDLEPIDDGFRNITDFNSLIYLYFNNEKDLFIKEYSLIEFNKADFVSINFRELNFLKKILEEYNISTKKIDYFIEIFKANKFSYEQNSVSEYKIENFKHLLFEQAYQLATYYNLLGRTQDSLMILSILSQVDTLNRDYYLFSKYELLLQASKNKKLFNNFKNFQTDIIELDFLKDKLVLINFYFFDNDKQNLINYFNAVRSKYDQDYILSLGFEVSGVLNSNLSSKESLDFIENCCLDLILETKSVDFLFKYGDLLEQNNRTIEAEKFISESLYLSGEYPSPIILNYLAYLWVELGKNYDLAEKMLVEAVELTNGENGAILDSLGWLYFNKHNLEIAEKWIYKAYVFNPEEPEIIDHLSQIYNKQGRTRESKFLDYKILNFHKDYIKIKKIRKRYDEKIF